jgi:two-component system CheB/CheR fusion protein
MQFPDITVPMVKIEGKRFVHQLYQEDLTHCIHAEIYTNDHASGRVSVYYTEDRLFIIPQEHNMLNALAKNLSLWLTSHKLTK